MANATPNRLGVNVGTTDGSWAQDNYLFEQLYLTEVMGAFLQSNVMDGITRSRTITHGKSASFPRMWKTDAQYHTPGTDLLGTNNVEQSEKIIKIDSRLASDVFVDTLDELKLHYDVRTEIARQQGHALAKRYDINAIRKIAQAARKGQGGASEMTFGSDFDGVLDRVVNNPNFATSGDDLVTGFWQAAEILDKNDVPAEDRYMVLGPQQYYLLFQSTNVFPLNRDYGGTGNVNTPVLPELAGFKVIKTNHMNQLGGNYAGETGEENGYAGDYTGSVGVAFHKDAIATLKLQDLTFNVVDQPQKFGNLLIASMACGTDILREEAAVELSTNAVGYGASSSSAVGGEEY